VSWPSPAPRVQGRQDSALQCRVTIVSSPFKPGLSAEDRAAIENVLALYCFSIDLRDWSRFAEIFTEDCVVQYGTGDRPSGIDGLVEFVRHRLSLCAATQHHTGPPCIDDTDPSRVRVLSNVVAVHLGKPQGGNAAEEFTVWGYYDDIFAQTDAGWRIAERRVNLIKREGNPDVLV
jgi:3-phenylpropionate/cinnamic acid dioxygenase small subunit